MNVVFFIGNRGSLGYYARPKNKEPDDAYPLQVYELRQSIISKLKPLGFCYRRMLSTFSLLGKSCEIVSSHRLIFD